MSRTLKEIGVMMDDSLADTAEAWSAPEVSDVEWTEGGQKPLDEFLSDAEALRAHTHPWGYDYDDNCEACVRERRAESQEKTP